MFSDSYLFNYHNFSIAILPWHLPGIFFNLHTMIQLNILYPKTNEALFNWHYYINVHMPLSVKLQGHYIKAISIGKGLEDIDAVPACYMAITIIRYDSVEDFMKAFMPNKDVLQNDMKNYTNVEPVIQFSEIIMDK
jgi:uncharacterized protein (TIGR02118 family)